MQMRIGGFGLAIHKNDQRFEHKSICGTNNYISPEVINHEGFVRRSDIWAIGVITYELLFGYLSFEEDNTYRRIDVLYKLITSKLNRNSNTYHMVYAVTSSRVE